MRPAFRYGYPNKLRTICKGIWRKSPIFHRIPPLARVSGLEAERGYVDVPEARAGRGEAWLVYRLTRHDALVEESVTKARTWMRGRARVVARVEFTYGP